MKAGISTLAALAFLTAPAFAAETLAQEAPKPTPQSDQVKPDAMPPAAPPATNPAAPSTTPSAPMTPSTPSTSPSMDRQAAAPSGDLHEEQNDDRMVPQLNASVDAVEDMDVYDASGKKIAEVEAVLVDEKGEVKGLVIEHGGFLGIGSRDAIITIDRVRTKDGNILADLTEEQLPTLPEWNR
ncbi:MAG TPA: PRC-barrel domain-containing protein [Hyphomicrobium sp.]|nr:PRC-barrel domain-containing protein [Hyphomicrobium sp.]